MTLRDLVLMARRLRDGAYLATAEISRLPKNWSGGPLAIRMRVPIDSVYVFARGTTTYPLLPGHPGAGHRTRAVGSVATSRQPEFELLRRGWITGR